MSNDGSDQPFLTQTAEEVTAIIERVGTKLEAAISDEVHLLGLLERNHAALLEVRKQRAAAEGQLTILRELSGER